MKPPGETEEDLVETRGGPRVERLWDDDAYRARIIELATLRGETVRNAVIKAGTNPKYMEPSPGGRNISITLRLAKHLRVHPAYLMFGPTVATGPDLGGKVNLADLPVATMIGASFEQRLAIIAQIVADHWLATVLDPAGSGSNCEAKLRQIAAIVR